MLRVSSLFFLCRGLGGGPLADVDAAGVNCRVFSHLWGDSFPQTVVGLLAKFLREVLRWQLVCTCFVLLEQKSHEKRLNRGLEGKICKANTFPGNAVDALGTRPTNARLPGGTGVFLLQAYCKYILL